MSRLTAALPGMLLLAGFVLTPVLSAGDQRPEGAVGLGDRGHLVGVHIGPPGDPRGLVIRGRHARQQLVVTGHYSSGQVHDLTHRASYEVSDPAVVQVDPTGLVAPLADGTVTIAAKTSGGIEGRIIVTVTGYHEEEPIHFPNQIVPIFTKLGCNSGGCHGKASGQNGFQLSLLGFEPDDDYEHLVKEVRGRRIFPAAPEKSLLLLKPTGQVPHGGGRRMSPDDYEYQMIYRWIAQGMPYARPDDPVVQRIEVYPQARQMGRHQKQQVAVTAYYTDGRTEDVTRMAQFEPNDTDLAAIATKYSDHPGAKVWGLVETTNLIGEVAVMARYQAQVDVFRATVPLGAPVDNLPEPRNFIDELVFAKLKALGVPPSDVCDDATFIRRVSLDTTGTLPAAEEVRQFLADSDPAKRDRLIDRLLESPAYADYFAVKWNAVLRNRDRDGSNRPGTYRFREWIRHSLYDNRPYDQFVREVVAASGDPQVSPAATWYAQVSQTSEQVEDTAQLFLGLRIQCARCHHHPFERWSQDDYFGFSAFFSRVGRKRADRFGEMSVFHNRGMATARHPRTGEVLRPTPLAGEPRDLSPDDDPRQSLVDWMASPENPYFARALVNRYWKHFFARGLVEPPDDMRVTNPPSNPELLDALADHFVKSGFDLKDLVRTICRSKVYQLRSEPNEYNAGDKQHFSRYYPKRLEAEVLYDAIHGVTQTQSSFEGYPAGTRSIAIRSAGEGNYFLTVFGRPQGASACECERSDEANLAQSLHLLNSSEIQGKLSADNGRAARLAKDTARPTPEKIVELYLSAFAREPRPEEFQIAVDYVDKAENKQHAYEDMIWALLNSKEFLFNH